MLKNTIAVGVALAVASVLVGASMHAQQGGATATAKACLHETNEVPDQTARRVAALQATRTINNIQANRPEFRSGGPRPSAFRQDELAAAPFSQGMGSKISLNPTEDIVPGWKLTLDVSEKGYWFIIKDTTDPCHFSFISNQDGVIYNTEPIR